MVHDNSIYLSYYCIIFMTLGVLMSLSFKKWKATLESVKALSIDHTAFQDQISQLRLLMRHYPDKHNKWSGFTDHKVRIYLKSYNAVIVILRDSKQVILSIPSGYHHKFYYTNDKKETEELWENIEFKLLTTS